MDDFRSLIDGTFDDEEEQRRRREAGEPYVPETTRADQLRARFERYHANNPGVYAHFDRLAHRAIARGLPRYSAYGIMHVIRFEVAMEIQREDAFRISNDIIPYYARLWVENNPAFAGFFELKELTTKRQPARAGEE